MLCTCYNFCVVQAKISVKPNDLCKEIHCFYDAIRADYSLISYFLSVCYAAFVQAQKKLGVVSYPQATGAGSECWLAIASDGCER
jgi:hypothetical protein